MQTTTPPPTAAERDAVVRDAVRAAIEDGRLPRRSKARLVEKGRPGRSPSRHRVVPADQSDPAQVEAALAVAESLGWEGADVRRVDPYGFVEFTVPYGEPAAPAGQRTNPQISTEASARAGTPNSSRARTNRILAAAAAAGVDRRGQAASSSRRVKDGSVHFVRITEGADSAAVADALRALDWPGAKVTDNGTHVEIRVPDYDDRGRPKRTFT